MLNTKQNSQEKEERLSQLISLKKLEKPNAAFWERFDEELQSKRLSALVQTQSRYDRWGQRALRWTKRIGPFAAIGSMASIAYVAYLPSQIAEDPSGENNKSPQLAAGRDDLTPPLFLVEPNDIPEERFANNSIPTFDVPATYGLNVLHSSQEQRSYTS